MGEADLPDFPFEPPRYATVADGLSMAYVEAGPVDGPPVLPPPTGVSWPFSRYLRVSK